MLQWEWHHDDQKERTPHSHTTWWVVGGGDGFDDLSITLVVTTGAVAESGTGLLQCWGLLSYRATCMEVGPVLAGLTSEV